MPKKRSDSKIRPEHKAQLRAWLVDQNLGYDEVRELMLERLGYQVATGTLSKFYAEECFVTRFAQAKQVADGLDLPAEQFDGAIIKAVKQAAFEMALDKEFDPRALARLMKILGDVTKLGFKREEIDLDKRRIELLERKAQLADAAEKVTRDETLTPEQRAAKYKEIFGLR